MATRRRPTNADPGDRTPGTSRATPGPFEHDDDESGTELSALPFIPPDADLDELRDASRGCRGCPLYKNATQTVFGEGEPASRVLLVGEQPGNDEDLQGHPFVGPAGRILDQALEAAGIDRSTAYVTNTVKHFKWKPQIGGKSQRRIHKKPSSREIAACLPWLEREIALIRPDVLVCLGATAAQALLGRDFKVTKMRGVAQSTPLAPNAVATIHPSSILRQQTSEDREREMKQFVADLKVAAKLLRK